MLHLHGRVVSICNAKLRWKGITNKCFFVFFSRRLLCVLAFVSEWIWMQNALLVLTAIVVASSTEPTPALPAHLAQSWSHQALGGGDKPRWPLGHMLTVRERTHSFVCCLISHLTWKRRSCWELRLNCATWRRLWSVDHDYLTCTGMAGMGISAGTNAWGRILSTSWHSEAELQPDEKALKP